MKKAFSKTLLFAAASVLSASTALAGVSAVATTDLNIRSGPGPQHQAIGVINNGDSATVEGCLDSSKWCQVSYNGKTGWSYSDYLAIEDGGSRVVITERRETLPAVSYQQNAVTTATTGAAGGAIAGALIGGPVGAAIGGAAGAVIGAAVSPPDQVRTYVTQNRVDPVYLEGEVVVGAGLPETVALRSVPDYEYEYVYVNGQPVLVDPATRRIVYVYR